MQESHTNTELEMLNNNFFFNNYTTDIFLFVTAIISILVTSIVMYILCKHSELKTLVTSLALQQIKVGTVTTQEGMILNIECTCKIQWYTSLMLTLSILGLVFFVILKSRKLKMCRGHLFFNIVKTMPFISDAQYCVPIKLCRTAWSKHLFKITGMLTPEM